MRVAPYDSYFVASAFLPLVNINYKIALCSASARFNISHRILGGKEITRNEIIHELLLL
jgi:hypothetical protein